MPKIWIGQDEYYHYEYSKYPAHGREVEISEDELKVLEEATEKFTEAQKILAKLMDTTLEKEGWGDYPIVWP